MLSFLVYEGKAAIALAVFYMFYRLLLKKESFHLLNRIVLVGMVVVSFVLPLCIITIHRPMEMAPIDKVTEVVSVQETAGTASGPWWPTALGVLFWIGAAFVLARMVISILSVIRVIRGGECVLDEGAFKVFVTEREIDPFSWMRYIVLSRKDWESPHESILEHEQAHIRHRHSFELLLVDTLTAFQWFNPAIWMLRMDLQEIHEYEADDAVLRSGANIKEYQYLLVRKAVGKSGYSVANSLNHSILKNRITMMSKPRSPRLRGLRVLWLLPLICLAVGLQAQTVYDPADHEKPAIGVPGGRQNGKTVTLILTVTADRKVKNGSFSMDLDGFGKHFREALGNTVLPEISVQVKAEPGVPRRYIDELKAELRKAGLLKVSYPHE